MTSEESHHFSRSVMKSKQFLNILAIGSRKFATAIIYSQQVLTGLTNKFSNAKIIFSTSFRYALLKKCL